MRIKDVLNLKRRQNDGVRGITFWSLEDESELHLNRKILMVVHL